MKKLLKNSILIILATATASFSLVAEESFPLDNLLKDKINLFNDEILPFMDDFTEQERLEISNRYKYLTDLRENNEILTSGFTKELYGSDVWHLNEALSFALGSGEGYEGWCETVNLKTTCPPLFWNYPVLFEVNAPVAKNLISMYILCVSERRETDELVVAVCSQMMLLLNGEDFSPFDSFKLVDWALDAIDKVQDLKQNTEKKGLETMESNFVLFVENMWTQNRLAFLPYLYCLSDIRPDLLELGAAMVFDQDFMQSVCVDKKGERFLEFVQENRMFTDQIDNIRAGDVMLLLE